MSKRSYVLGSVLVGYLIPRSRSDRYIFYRDKCTRNLLDLTSLFCTFVGRAGSKRPTYCNHVSTSSLGAVYRSVFAHNRVCGSERSLYRIRLADLVAQ
jgi:hypothetical protein